MMDGLVRLHAAAKPLLARVDATLASHGAPADHPVVLLLRRRGLLPGDAVANIVAWEPEPLRERAGVLRTHRERCTAVDTLLRAPSTWEGAAAGAFAARLDTVRAEHDTLAANAATLAGHLDELADWIAQGRARLAHTLAAAITSTQCVTLTAGIPTDIGPAANAVLTSAVLPAGAALAGAALPNGALPGALASAAADLAVELLAAADHFWQGALDLSDAWSKRLDPIAHAPMATPVRPDSTDLTLRADL